MKKHIFIIVLALVPMWLAAQNANTQTPTLNRTADEDYYDEYEYDGGNGFTPSAYVLDDSDGVYVIDNSATDSTSADSTIDIEPSYTTETVTLTGNPITTRRVETFLVQHPADTTAKDTAQEEEKPQFTGDGHHLQIGFGAGWSGMFTRVSEDLGVSRMTAPAFTGNISYMYFPLKWIGFGTGVHISNYQSNILFNSDALKIYDKYIDADGKYRFMEDADGDRYRHRIGMGNFNEIENIIMAEIPFAIQLKHKFGGIAGIYTTLGVKLGIPFASTYKVKSGLIEHYGYYGQYNLTLRNVPGYFGTLDYTNRGGSYSAGKQLLPVNFLGYAELGTVIRLTERIDMMIGAYFDINIHDVTMAHRDAQKTPIGFNAAPYNYPWMSEFRGLIGTDMLGEIRPYNVGIKVALDFNLAPAKKNKKDKDDEDKDEQQTPQVNKTDTLRDTLVIIHDTVIIHRITDHYEYDTIGYDPDKHNKIRSYLDPNSNNPYVNGSQTRSPQQNSYDPADGDDYVYNKEALEKGRKYSEDLHNRNEALSGDEQEMADYLSALSIRFQLDKAYPPFVVPRQGLNVVANTLKQNPDIVIAVNGHACRLGTERYNRRLALRRARNIAKLLKMRGVDESQMLVASYGSHVPSAYGAHSLSKDRRVELVILGSMTYEQREAYLNKFAEQIEIQDMIHEGQRDNAYDLYDSFSGELRVKQGTSLARIAANYYGDPDWWVYLYEANSDIITNPRVIEPGTTLMVPERDKIINGRSMKAVKHEALQLREYYLRQIGYSGTEL